MNIFALSIDPYLAAKWQCDKHIVKMPLESAQMKSTIFREINGVLGDVKSKNVLGDIKITKRFILPEFGEKDGMWDTEKCPIYWGVHSKHPCTLWCRESKSNWEWHKWHALYLCDEYKFRYGKTHASKQIIDLIISNSIDLPNKCLTRFALAMPEEYKTKSAVKSYRAYYQMEKSKFAKWSKRKPPYWWEEVNNHE